jgi:uncharacterized LabA/DUF88 family protein
VEGGTVLKKVLAFVDGENIVARFQAMRKAGRVVRSDAVHVQDAFVWSPHVTIWTNMDLLRVQYYTSVVGDDQKVEEVVSAIAGTQFKSDGGAAGWSSAHLIPRVHKKAQASPKVKIVDIDITMDVMRAALTMPIDAIYLLTGDGDYLPLVREVTFRTSKQMYVGAFSSGLAPSLRSSGEAFVDLDGKFFGE